jgi:hypothetical protein
MHELCAGMLKALTACEAYPTLVLQLEHMQTDLMRFTYKLYAMLGQAGVSGLQMPARGPMRQHFGSFIKSARPHTLPVTDHQTQLTMSHLHATCLFPNF